MTKNYKSVSKLLQRSQVIDNTDSNLDLQNVTYEFREYFACNRFSLSYHNFVPNINKQLKNFALALLLNKRIHITVMQVF